MPPTSILHFAFFRSACPTPGWVGPLQNRDDTHSGGAHDGFSCPRQWRCAASRRDKIAPHSGQSMVDRFGLALHDVVLCRSLSCSRENVLVQYSHGNRFFDLEERAAAARRRLPVARRVGVRREAGADAREAGEDVDVDADAKDGEGEAGGTGTRSGIAAANVDVDADVEVEVEDGVGEAGGGAGAMARKLRLTYSSPSSKLPV
jgi:hypothetical protein